MEDKDFELVELPEEARDPEIKKEDFTLAVADDSIHEQKFQTKPTTFFKDSLKRFRKNKSSVVAAYILGALILLSIFVPIFSNEQVSGSLAPEYKNLEPKLFDGGGFWDGTKLVKEAAIDTDTGLPDPDNYTLEGIQQDTIQYTGEVLTNTPSKYGKDGYLEFGYYVDLGATEAIMTSCSPEDLSYISFELDLDYDQLYLSSFDTADLEKVNKYAPGYSAPTNFTLGKVALEFVFHEDGATEDTIVPITDYEVAHNVGLDAGIYENTDPIDINAAIASKTTQKQFTNFYFRLRVIPASETDADKNVCALVKSLVITTNSDDPKQQAYFSPDQSTIETVSSGKVNIVGISFYNAMEFTSRKTEMTTEMLKYLNIGFWTTPSDRYFSNVYLGKCIYASFKYDSYAAAFGPRIATIGDSKLEIWKSYGWIDYGITLDESGDDPVVDVDAWEEFCDNHNGYIIVVYNEKCPIIQSSVLNLTPDDVYIGQTSDIGYTPWDVEISVLNYKLLGRTSMPKFIFGTDKSGYDMFKYVFEGLRNSLLLGVITFAVCFVFGLIYGAISGYFGGTVDLVMERITDIISGLPWIVLMTLIILKAGQTFVTFAIALCLTGWIGTASTTRTQFYRFRGREYVLASRTLGASDARLIAKHILPNAMGTIITGAVLMIPSVIFSEATISYLGLGFKGMSSLGVILSDNQSELFYHPYQLLFPSVVIALVMISFNLFGNGLRDAINPSLKGEDE